MWEIINHNHPLYKKFIPITFLNLWITNNYNELKTICSKITRGQDYEDLLHICVEQFLHNQVVKTIPDKEKLFFFARIVRNQYNSKSSKYHYTYRKYQFNELVEYDIPDVEYEETQFNLSWVKEELKKIDWYYGRLFELYIEEGCSVTKLSKRTTIPINSVSRDINKVRRHLKQKRNGMRM
jgi:DNA-directed RNA polymerase specialized sigma24 family protein